MRLFSSLFVILVVLLFVLLETSHVSAGISSLPGPVLIDSWVAGPSGGQVTFQVEYNPVEEVYDTLLANFTVTCNPGNHQATSTGSPVADTGNIMRGMVVVGGLGSSSSLYFNCAVVGNVIYSDTGNTPSSPMVHHVQPWHLPSRLTSISYNQIEQVGGGVEVDFVVPTNNGIEFVGVTVYDNNNAFVSRVEANIPAETSITILGLTNGQSYQIMVDATNEIGLGPSSTFPYFIPMGVPDKPVITAVTADDCDGSVRIYFNAINKQGSDIVQLILSNDQDAYPTEITCYFDEWDNSACDSPIRAWGLAIGTYYSFTLQAVNIIGSGLLSEFSDDSVTPTSAPNSPEHPGMVATLIPNELLLTFTYSTDIQSTGGDNYTDFAFYQNNHNNGYGQFFPHSVLPSFTGSESVIIAVDTNCRILEDGSPDYSTYYNFLIQSDTVS